MKVPKGSRRDYLRDQASPDSSHGVRSAASPSKADLVARAMAGGGGGNTWIKQLVAGGAMLITATGMHMGHVGNKWLMAALLAVGGLLVVFASCDLMIQSVEGLATRLKWNQFVAGTMAGLASNVPEVVMLGFVIAAGARVGFIVVMFTLHVGAMCFGVYSAVLPRDERGQARLPTPLVKLSTDLYACAGGIFLAWGFLLMMLNLFVGKGATGQGEEMTAAQLYAIGAAFIIVEIVAVRTLVKNFSSSEGEAPGDEEGAATPEASWGRIAALGGGGVLLSVWGGHGVGDFAGILVEGLTAAGYSQMVGALILSIFAVVGPFIMIGTAHAKKNYDVALANASGAVTQVPFVVLPIALIMIAAFAQTGVIPALPHGGALHIDLQTTSVVLLGFPPMLVLWKAVQDDGAVNWVETATMIAIFALTLFFLGSE